MRAGCLHQTTAQCVECEMLHDVADHLHLHQGCAQAFEQIRADLRDEIMSSKTAQSAQKTRQGVCVRARARVCGGWVVVCVCVWVCMCVGGGGGRAWVGCVWSVWRV